MKETQVHEIKSERDRVAGALAQVEDPIRACIDQVELMLWRQATAVCVPDPVGFVCDGLRQWAETLERESVSQAVVDALLAAPPTADCSICGKPRGYCQHYWRKRMEAAFNPGPPPPPNTLVIERRQRCSTCRHYSIGQCDWPAPPWVVADRSCGPSDGVNCPCWAEWDSSPRWAVGEEDSEDM